MASSQEIVFYDLVGTVGGPLWSPNTWKTRMSLLHKCVSFRTVELTGTGLRRDLGKRIGKERPLLPALELPDGRFVDDSFEIALFLDKEYPNAPSLFTPSDPAPSTGAYETAVGLARIFNLGIGSSDPGWTVFFELAYPGIIEAVPNPNERAYMKSDYKLGVKDGWKKITALDRRELRERAKASLLPFQSVLTQPGVEYLAAEKAPGFVDYVLFGRFAMIAAVDMPLARDVFASVDAWVERMLELYGGHAREQLQRQMPA